ncbi:MAG: hypothetical protein IPO31_05795 [Candidatus Obscuribacter sp.]|nr:hypothetical protein [Candidatus Obscuribacter sp.]
MLEKFLGVRMRYLVLRFLELFGLPVRLTQSFGDLSVEDMISLAATCRAIQLLIDLSNDEAASLDMYVNHSIVMPTDACMAALYNLSQSEPLIKYLKKIRPSTDFWIAFSAIYAQALKRRSNTLDDGEKLVLGFWKRYETASKAKSVIRFELSSFGESLKYFQPDGFPELVPVIRIDSAFEISHDEWCSKSAFWSKLVIRKTLKALLDVSLSNIHPTLVWKPSGKSDFVLREGISLDCPWNLMVMELFRRALGQRKLIRYCPRCGKPNLRSKQAKTCADCPRYKVYREKKSKEDKM